MYNRCLAPEPGKRLASDFRLFIERDSTHDGSMPMMAQEVSSPSLPGTERSLLESSVPSRQRAGLMAMNSISVNPQTKASDKERGKNLKCAY